MSLYQKRSTNHFGHLILTILFFPWAIAWIAFYISNRNHNDRVDERLHDLHTRRG